MGVEYYQPAYPRACVLLWSNGAPKDMLISVQPWSKGRYELLAKSTPFTVSAGEIRQFAHSLLAMVGDSD